MVSLFLFVGFSLFPFSDFPALFAFLFSFFCFITISPFIRKGPRGPVPSHAGCFVLPVLDCVQKTEEDSLAPATARRTDERNAGKDWTAE